MADRKEKRDKESLILEDNELKYFTAVSKREGGAIF